MSDTDGKAHGQVRISTRTCDEGIEVSVADDGPGVSAAQMERIFDDFYTTKPGGIGLGLSISRSLVRSHGGDLWLERGAPRGATFRFRLPSETRD